MNNLLNLISSYRNANEKLKKSGGRAMVVKIFRKGNMWTQLTVKLTLSQS